MIWLFVVLAALCTFVIAAVAIGWVTSRQELRPRRALYDLDEAVEYVADTLPPEITAEVSYEQVGEVLLWHLEYLHGKGVASARTDERGPERLVVVTDDEPVAYLLGRADEAGLGLTDEQILAILEAERRYAQRIGAIGGPVDEPRIG